MKNIKNIVEKYLRRFPEEKVRQDQLCELISKNEESALSDRLNYFGHITASGFIISTSRREVLRVWHKKLDRLLQPGGHIELADKSPLEAAIREIREETSLKSIDHIAFHPDVQVPIDIDTHSIKKSDGEPEHLHHDFRYLFISRDMSELELIDEELESYKWGPIAELMNMATFEDLKPKIEHALSNEFRAKLFFDKMIEITNLDKECNSIVVGHVVSDSKVFLNALNEKAPIITAIPKPKSCDEAVVLELQKNFPIEHFKRELIRDNPELIKKIIHSSDKPCVLFDIGGYFAPIINQLTEKCPGKILGVIEDTENGYQKYEREKELKVPVISVARSPLKQNEDFLVGQSILYSTDAILREVGFNVEYQTCAVLGHGKIGASIAHHLLMRGVKPWVYDKDPIRRISASNRMCLIPSREEILTSSDVIFCATGNASLKSSDFEKLKPGCVICSVTSSDDELDLSGLHQFECETLPSSQLVKKYSSFGNYFYLVNDGNAVNFVHKAALGSYIHLVRAEMMYVLTLLANDNLSPGIYNIEEKLLNERIRNPVAEKWLEIYADAPQTHNNLGVTD